MPQVAIGLLQPIPTNISPDRMMKVFVLALLIAVATASVPTFPKVEDLAATIERDWPVDADTAETVAKLVLQHAEPTDLLIPELEPPVAEPRTLCPTLPPRTPASVIANLHPEDIKVTGAIGDSISCATNALSTTWFNLKEYPGLVWSEGGDEGATTMPNIEAEFSGPLIGPSLGTGDGVRNLNMAVGGSIVQDMPGQATALVAAIKADSSINWEEDWKEISLWIGGNNLCVVCKSGGMTDNGPTAYAQYLTQTLDILYQIPRVMISMVAHFDYTQLAAFKGPFCGIVLPFVCDCLTSGDSSKQDVAREVLYQYNDVLYDLQTAYNNGSRDDWAVVVQPFLVNTTIPSKEYISTADCFHPSGLGQAFFATAYWNSLISPMDSKPTASEPGLPIVCPDENTLMYNPYSPTSSSS